MPELSDGGDAVLAGVPLSLGGRASAAVRAAPKWKDGSRRVRYVNPINGGPTMPLMDCYLIQIDKGTETVRFRTTSNAVCLVCEGRGTTKVGEDTIAWEKRDVFSLPHGNWITHKADETSTLFLVTDRDALRRLDLLKEQYGNEFYDDRRNQTTARAGPERKAKLAEKNYWDDLHGDPRRAARADPHRHPGGEGEPSCRWRATGRG